MTDIFFPFFFFIVELKSCTKSVRQELKNISFK